MLSGQNNNNVTYLGGTIIMSSGWANNYVIWEWKEKGDFFTVFYVLCSTLFHLPPLIFHSVGGCWDRTEDSWNFGIGYLSDALTTRLDHIQTARCHPQNERKKYYCTNRIGWYFCLLTNKINFLSDFKETEKQYIQYIQWSIAKYTETGWRYSILYSTVLYKWKPLIIV